MLSIETKQQQQRKKKSKQFRESEFIMKGVVYQMLAIEVR